MEKYIGLKMVEAERKINWIDNPINRQTVGWNDGYKVICEDGYELWIDKETFEKTYRRVDNMSFGFAIEAMKKGLAVCRKEWLAKKMWICLYVPIDNMDFKDGTSFSQAPYIVMKIGNNKIVPWDIIQADILADDWQIVE